MVVCVCVGGGGALAPPPPISFHFSFRWRPLLLLFASHHPPKKKFRSCPPPFKIIVQPLLVRPRKAISMVIILPIRIWNVMRNLYKMIYKINPVSSVPHLDKLHSSWGEVTAVNEQLRTRLSEGVDSVSHSTTNLQQRDLMPFLQKSNRTTMDLMLLINITSSCHKIALLNFYFSLYIDNPFL